MGTEVVLEREANNFGFLRLLFAILVILSHSPELLDGNRSREILTGIFHSLSFGELAVDGFFLISGYLITKSWEKSATARIYLTKRVLRIYPGFIAAFILSLLLIGPIAGGNLQTLLGRPGLEQAVRMVFLRGPQLDGVFPGMPYPSLNGSMWTIAYEFRCYLLTMLLGALGVIANRWAYLGVTMAFLAVKLLGTSADIHLPQALELITGTVSNDARFFFIFCCGGLFHVFRDDIPYKGSWALLATLALAAMLGSGKTAELGVAIFGAYTLFWFSFHAKANVLSRVDNRVDLSYGLYLYAWPVQSLLIMNFPAISPWVLFALATVLAACCGLASWILIERPSMSFKPGWRPA